MARSAWGEGLSDLVFSWIKKELIEENVDLILGGCGNLNRLMD